MKFSPETTKKIAALAAARARLAELQSESSSLMATLEDVTQQLAATNKQTAAELYLAGKHVDIGRLTETRTQSRARLVIVQDAIALQRHIVAEADNAAAVSASEDAKPAYRKAYGEAALAMIAALVAIEKTRAITDDYEAAGLLRMGVLEPVAFPALGSLRDEGARWASWLKEAMAYTGMSTGEVASAFGQYWPIARKSLGIDDTSPIAKAGRAIATAIGA